MLRSRLCLSLLLAGLALPAGCSREEVLQRTFYPMGNVPFQVKAYDVPSGLFDETFEKIRQETQRLETILSCFVEAGDVVRLNRSGSETVSAELAQVLQVALKVAEQTDGAFDVTIGPVVDLWKRCAA